MTLRFSHPPKLFHAYEGVKGAVKFDVDEGNIGAASRSMTRHVLMRDRLCMAWHRIAAAAAGVQAGDALVSAEGYSMLAFMACGPASLCAAR